MENKISVHNLKKNFGKLEVLKDISIEIREGEVVCMIGPLRFRQKYVSAVSEPPGEDYIRPCGGGRPSHIRP